MQHLRTTSALTLGLTLACTPTSEPIGGTLPGDSTGSSSTGEPATTLEPTTAPTTDDTGPTTSSASTGEPGSSSSSSGSSGEQLEPGCGDGIADVGELCFTFAALDVFPWALDLTSLVDVDGDGHLDIVGASRVPCPLTTGPELRRVQGPLALSTGPDPSRDGANIMQLAIAFGDGLGGFVAGPSTGSTRFGWGGGLATADVTGDGKVDVLVISSTNTLLRYTGNGGAEFGEPVELALPAEVWRLSAGDLDGDGDVDLVGIGDAVVVLLGDGKGGFSATSFAADAGTFRTKVLLHDLDADGDLDVVIGRAWLQEAAVEVLHNDGAGVLTSKQQIDMPDDVIDLVVLDDATDGRPAVLVSGYKDGYKLAHLLVAADGTLAAPQVMQGGPQSLLTTGHFDGGDRPDVMLPDSLGLTALLGQDPWPPLPVAIPDLKVIGQNSPPSTGDVNEDGVTDIVVAGTNLFLSNP